MMKRLNEEILRLRSEWPSFPSSWGSVSVFCDRRNLWCVIPAKAGIQLHCYFHENGNSYSLENWSGSPINTFGDDKDKYGDSSGHVRKYRTSEWRWVVILRERSSQRRRVSSFYFLEQSWIKNRQECLFYNDEKIKWGDPSLTLRMTKVNGAYLYFATEGSSHLKFVKHKHE